MSNTRPNATFSGSQTAGVINNIAGDQVNYGGVQGTIQDLQQQVADVETIRRLLDEVPLTERDRTSSVEAVERLHEELTKPEPSKPKAAAALDDLTTVLKAAGVLAGAGLALVDPIGRIAVGIGAAAASVLKALGR
jgi:hypothetical protein